MKKSIILGLFLFFITPTIAFARSDKITVEFEKCVDGDTAVFKYKNNEMKVRFLAIDTPETVNPNKAKEEYGKTASDYTCNKISNATTIELEFDEFSDELDKYDRYLVWIFVDDSLLQKELIKNGLAKVAYLYGNYKYTEELQDVEKIAKNEKLGIWKDYEENNTSFYVIIGLVALLIITILIPYFIKNKNIKNLSKKSNSLIKKELNKLFKK